MWELSDHLLTNIVFDLVKNWINFLIFVISIRKLAELDPPIYLTEEEIENYKEAFVDYDVDGSGNINILGTFFIVHDIAWSFY